MDGQVWRRLRAGLTGLLDLAGRQAPPPLPPMPGPGSPRTWNYGTVAGPAARTGSASQRHRDPRPAAARLRMNQLWYELVAMACELLAWIAVLALDRPARAWEPKRQRLRLLAAAGRLVRGGRRLRLRPAGAAAGNPGTAARRKTAAPVVASFAGSAGDEQCSHGLFGCLVAEGEPGSLVKLRSDSPKGRGRCGPKSRCVSESTGGAARVLVEAPLPGRMRVAEYTSKPVAAAVCSCIDISRP